MLEQDEISCTIAHFWSSFASSCFVRSTAYIRMSPCKTYCELLSPTCLKNRRELWFLLVKGGLILKLVLNSKSQYNRKISFLHISSSLSSSSSRSVVHDYHSWSRTPDFLTMYSAEVRMYNVRIFPSPQTYKCVKWPVWWQVHLCSLSLALSGTSVNHTQNPNRLKTFVYYSLVYFSYTVLNCSEKILAIS